MDDDVFAAKFVHHFFHAILGGIIFEGLVDVGIGWRITANKTTEPWNNPLQVPKINPSPRREAGLTKIEHKHFATGLGEAIHFAQAVFKTGEVAQTESDCNAIKMIIGQPGIQRITFAEGDGEIAIAADCLIEHGLAEIKGDHVRSAISKGEGNITRATAEVQHTLAGSGVRKGYEAIFPVSMQP